MLHRMLPSVRTTCTVLVAAVLTFTIALPPAAAQEAEAAEKVRAVLVTGASSGIGLRTTEVLSKNGFFVYAGARKAEDLERLNAMENVMAVRLDVTIQSEIDAAVKLVRTEGRGLYGLINNAGVAVMGPLIELREEDMQFQLDVNLLGPYRVTKAFADLLIDSRGRVMTVSSIAGILSGPFLGPYSMSKHGVEAFVDALAAEFDRFGIAVAAVEPGNYKSRIVANMVARMRATGYSAEGSRYGSMLDLVVGSVDRSQYGEPDDVALAALDFLTSDTPKRRYMVVPNRGEAAITIRQALREVAELNQEHRFSFSRDELVQMLDEALGIEQPSSSALAGTALHQAAMEGDLDAARERIAAGADLNAREPMGGSSPLITAATFGQTGVAKALIAAGADVDQRNNDGSTALMTAAFFCRTEIVEALLAAGADKDLRNATGLRALDIVSAPFASMKVIYEMVGAALKPYGLELDYERLERTRPEIAELLR